MCHPQGRSIAEDARSALTRRPARRYAVNDLPPAPVRHARRRSDARHGAVNSEVAALPGAARRPADRASNYPHPFEESLFYFGEHPDNVSSLQSAVAAASERSGGDKFRAAISLGLALQACYLVDVTERMKVLRWVIKVLAASKDEFVEAVCREGGRPVIAFVWYYLFARESVACTMPAAVKARLEEAVGEGLSEGDERDTRRFWLIVGELEAGNMREAERLPEGFDPVDDRLALGIYLGAFLVQHLRVSTEADRKFAGRVIKRFEGRLGGLRKQLYEEFKSEVLEVRNGDIAALPEAETSATEGDEDGGGRPSGTDNG